MIASAQRARAPSSASPAPIGTNIRTLSSTSIAGRLPQRRHQNGRRADSAAGDNVMIPTHTSASPRIAAPVTLERPVRTAVASGSPRDQSLIARSTQERREQRVFRLHPLAVRLIGIPNFRGVLLRNHVV